MTISKNAKQMKASVIPLNHEPALQGKKGPKNKVDGMSKKERQREWRLLKGGNTRSQKTLTQMKFMPGTMEDDDDVDLEYIGEPSEDHREDRDVLQSRKRRKRSAVHRHKLNSAPDETLTQLDWLRAPPTTTSARGNRGNRNIKMQSARRKERQPSPVPRVELRSRNAKKRPVSEMETIEEEPEEPSDDGSSCRPKRIKRSHTTVKAVEPNVVDLTNTDDAENSQTAIPQNIPVRSNATSQPNTADRSKLTPTIPKTPQKPVKREIPSSQSPESPAITLTTPKASSTSPSRPPLMTLSPNKVQGTSTLQENEEPEDHPEIKPKKLFPSSPQDREAHTRTDPDEQAETLSTPVATEQPPDETMNTIKASQRVNESKGTSNNTSETRRRREKSVNDTDDDESDFEMGGFDDALPQTPNAKVRRTRSRSQQSAESRDAPANSEADQHPGPSEDIPQSTPASDPSVLYYRRPMSYHFEPTNQGIPDLSSAGLAELFATQGEIPNQGMSAERDKDDAPTNFVPESSPNQPSNGANAATLVGNDDDSHDPPSSPIILVQSSQPLSGASDHDENKQQQPDEQHQQENGPRRRPLTASQLLTDSLMESLPGPPGCMASQCSDMQDDELS